MTIFFTMCTYLQNKTDEIQGSPEVVLHNKSRYIFDFNVLASE